MRTYDGRETAPAAAKPELFLRPDGRPRGFPTRCTAATASAYQGSCACWGWRTPATASCPGRACSEPAIALAKDGFVVSPRLSKLITDRGAALFAPEARAYFFDVNGTPKQAGEKLWNPAFAATLEAMAAAGPDAFYKGPIADAVVAAVAVAPTHQGHLRKSISPATWPRSACRRASPIAAIASAAWGRRRQAR